MQHGTVAELLACSPMFSGLGSELLSAIILRGDMVRFDAGQPVTLAGAPADSALYILEGRVALPEQGADDITPTLEPGAAISEMAMFVEMDHYHNSIALEDVVALQISRELMKHLVFECPVLADCFAANIRNNLTNTARRLHELNAMLDDSTLSVPEFDTVVEDDGFPTLPAALSQGAEETPDIHFPVMPPPEVATPELSSKGFGGNALEMSGLGADLNERINIEDTEGMPVDDIMAELSQFSLQPG